MSINKIPYKNLEKFFKLLIMSRLPQTEKEEIIRRIEENEMTNGELYRIYSLLFSEVDARLDYERAFYEADKKIDHLPELIREEQAEIIRDFVREYK